jgi:glucose-1-phosphate thymidylyltransferase
MKVIIPVAGVGKRLQPHTFTKPKALLTVGGRPVLAYVLDPLLKLEPEEVIFVIGSKGELVRDFIRQNYSFKSRFVNQERLLGLGYAMHLALEKIEKGPVLAILGDTIVECDMEKFVQAGDNVLGLCQVADPRRFGVAHINDGHIDNLVEKPQQPRSDLALIGLYYFREVEGIKKQLSALVNSGQQTAGEIQLTDALQKLIANGEKCVPYEVHHWHDCGNKQTLLETNRYILSKMPPPSEIKGSLLVPPVFIAPDAEIVNSILGPNVSVAEGAVIVNSILSNTIVGSKARISNAVLSDSLVGQNAVVTGREQTINIGDSSEIET